MQQLHRVLSCTHKSSRLLVDYRSKSGNWRWTFRPFHALTSADGHDVITVPVEKCFYHFDSFSSLPAEKTKISKAAKLAKIAEGLKYLPKDAADAISGIWK